MRLTTLLKPFWFSTDRPNDAIGTLSTRPHNIVLLPEHDMRPVTENNEWRSRSKGVCPLVFGDSEHLTRNRSDLVLDYSQNNASCALGTFLGTISCSVFEVICTNGHPPFDFSSSSSVHCLDLETVRECGSVIKLFVHLSVCYPRLLWRSYFSSR